MREERKRKGRKNKSDRCKGKEEGRGDGREETGGRRERRREEEMGEEREKKSKEREN